ncbi:MAG: hypothetical protein GF347_04800 [Candidatus Moranbacteria bacterium]|nr:hypothetical protein [Candidatus Moranbacteria bacterium]
MKAVKLKQSNNALIEKTPAQVILQAVKDLKNERMQTVLIQRFGLNDSEPKTLENIGRQFGITRERVRQIEKEALKKIEKDKFNNGVIDLIDKINKLLEKYQGIISEIRIFKEFNRKQRIKDLDKKALVLVLKMGSDFYYLNKPQQFEKAWYFKNANLESIKSLNNWLNKELKKVQKPISKKQLLNIINSNEQLTKIPDAVLYSYVDVPKKVQQNIFGRWGLSDWSEIQPKKVKDKIYLVLKKHQRPMHYKEIAEEISALHLDNKKICTPTVHNELIKDERFILTGRGIYALKEWNFYPGTVKEVLINILKNKKNNKADKKTLLNETLAQRQVKSSTILLNLQDSKYFKKKGDNYYLVKR